MTRKIESKVIEDDKWVNERINLISRHLECVNKEIGKLIIEIKKDPYNFGDFENRLYLAMKGIDPYRAVCTKHNQKLFRNDYGEFLCRACLYETDLKEEKRGLVYAYDRNLWFDPENKPWIQIKGINYGYIFFGKKRKQVKKDELWIRELLSSLE